MAAKIDRNRGRSSAGPERAASRSASVCPFTSFMLKNGRRSAKVPSS